MRRLHRIGLTTTLIAGGAVAVVAVTSMSRGAEGPVSSGLSWLGAATRSVEHWARQRIAGPGRADALSWFAPIRDDVARLRKPDVILLGAFDAGIPQTLDGVVHLEQALGTTFPLIQLYAAWGDKPEQRFPRSVVGAIADLGSIPMITWEPWLTDFESPRHPGLLLPAARELHGLAAVARGDYDFHVDAWARDAARYGRPLFLRFAHEMNDPYRYPWGPQNNSKEEYIAAWRHVVDRFRLAGAHNVLWVWSPHVAYDYWELYYPGADYVDWVATGVLNFGPIAQWSQWWTFDHILGPKYPGLASFDKPVMVAEFGSLAVGGDRIDWYRQALTEIPARYPAVRALLFFEAAADQTVTYQKVDWTVAGDSVLAATIRQAISPWAPQNDR